MATSSPRRRRQRSVRVTVAGMLLTFATLVIAVVLPTQSAGWLSIASVTALLCGFAASRIVYNELLDSWRDAASQRAAQARAYQAMLIEQAGEHVGFVTAMTSRLASRERSIRERDVSLMFAQKRVAEAETRVKRESRRANDALDLVAELQVALEIRKAEEIDELASWEGANQLDGHHGGETGTVVELLAWEDRVDAGRPSDASERKRDISRRKRA